MNVNKMITKSIAMIILILVITLGISYAYFQAKIKGLESTSTISIGGASFSIEYTGTKTITAQNIIPGWSDKKYFKLDIQNSRNETINYDINLVVVNSNFYTTDELGKAYLKYGLYECSSSSDTDCTTELAPTKLLDINGSGTKTIKTITNNKTETKYYALELKYPNQSVPQTQKGEDGNLVTFSGYVTINSSSSKLYDGPKIVDYIASLDKSSNGLEVDNTDDKNLRYTGSNPSNYVEFGNTGELWRIVGIFNVKDSQGNTARNIKLVRDTKLGDFSWDATGNNDYGINDWSEADLMQELNGDYLNTSLTANKTNWYNSYWDSTTQKPVFRQTGVFDYTKTIKQKYQDMINNSVWNIGGNGYTGSAPYTLNLLTQYNAERGTTTYQNSRATTWTGKVGLIYASDYGFASTNEECRNNLRAGITYVNNTWDYSNGLCKTDNWLFKSNVWYWTLSPYSGYTGSMFHVDVGGAVITRDAYNALGVFPAVFLKSNILIESGEGTKTNPYKLG